MELKASNEVSVNTFFSTEKMEMHGVKQMCGATRNKKNSR